MLKGKFGVHGARAGRRASDVDHRADLFVAGVVLWEMLTRRRLFKGGNGVQTIGMVRAAAVLPPSTFNPAVPPELDAVCMRALAKNRNERFADCGEMAEALDDFVHRVKFGATGAARVMAASSLTCASRRSSWRSCRWTTAASHAVASTPDADAGGRGAGEAGVERAGQRADGDRPVAVVADAAAAEKAIARLTEPTLRAWKQRERRRMIVVAAAATLAVAGVIVGRGPAPAAVTPAAPPSGVVTAPMPDAPWLTAPVAVPRRRRRCRRVRGSRHAGDGAHQAGDAAARRRGHRRGRS